jgi:predicted metal-dependent hydrolase
MAKKEFVLDEGLPVTIYKRRGSRNLRLSVNAQGQVRVTIPAWAPYRAGVAFAKARRPWILEQQRPLTYLVDGQAVGKAHHLSFIVGTSSKVITRVSETSIIIRHPAGLSPQSAEVQKAAREASVRALRQQAEKLLPQRLASLSEKYGFTYGRVSVRRLKGRWGSCDHQKNIVLNLFMMQLPWELIDYVLLHELTHTRILRHGPDFWRAMAEVAPNVKELRKSLKEHRPVMA